MTTTAPRIAIIVSGQTRCIDRTLHLFRGWTETADLFVVTNRAEDAAQKELLGLAKAWRFIEDDSALAEEEAALLTHPEGGKAAQWLKLAEAWRLLEAYEAEHDIRYDAVYKLRTDLHYVPDARLDHVRHLASPDEIFMESDLVFGGSRKAFAHAAAFHSRVSYYWGDHLAFKPIPIAPMLASHPNAGRFHWFNYPKTMFPDLIRWDDEHSFRAELTARADELEAYNRDPGSVLDCFNGRGELFRELVFPSEPAFAHHLLVSGLSCQRILPGLLEPACLMEDRRQV
ncbi:hypothetical protein [Brevundimonas goettingensis]|uniref:Uncharacterized protein n=1 Tax=Brevundimonas goettingensis TaxID=2774190 RepID=A0A975C5L3_9CAUL|nr:hypothetical protein [Brevundimonas goettingensis]QTC91686.1 hypothetical protein IFJ75_01745 [Brevundimonas goettingensis]